MCSNHSASHTLRDRTWSLVPCPAADLPAPARASGHAVRTRLRDGSKAPEKALAEVPRAEKPAKCRGLRSLRSGSKAPRDRKRSGGGSSRMPPIKRRELAVDLPPEQLPEEDLDEQDAMQAILSASVPPVKNTLLPVMRNLSVLAV